MTNSTVHAPDTMPSMPSMPWRRGFLAAFEPCEVELPDVLAPALELAEGLPRYLPTGRIRSLVRRLPEVDLTDWFEQASDAQLRMALMRYAFLAQAYVWGEAAPDRHLPAVLARPIWALAERLGQQPLLPYSSYTLDNWRRIDPERGFELDNLHVLQSFLGGQDEAWFILVHVAIESRAGEIVDLAPSILAAARERNYAALESALGRIVATCEDINDIFWRMPERCDPHTYFHRVRPFIHGWKDNPALGDGVVYEGVAETGGAPQQFRGQTGSQSSIVPTLDALLSVSHAADPLRAYLDELHAYRPPQHRRFIDAVRANSKVRTCVEDSAQSGLRETYNECLRQVSAFRTRHLQYAASYINKQQRGDAGNDTEVGTGGTPFMRYLRKHRGETDGMLLTG
ncbi:MAG: indoleamine 2,3-dioxygenase [Pseudomonadota bacterium]